MTEEKTLKALAGGVTLLNEIVSDIDEEWAQRNSSLIRSFCDTVRKLADTLEDLVDTLDDLVPDTVNPIKRVTTLEDLEMYKDIFPKALFEDWSAAIERAQDAPMENSDGMFLYVCEEHHLPIDSPEILEDWGDGWMEAIYLPNNETVISYAYKKVKKDVE